MLVVVWVLKIVVGCSGTGRPIDGDLIHCEYDLVVGDIYDAGIGTGSNGDAFTFSDG